MSESYCHVVQLEKINKLPNSDNLSITEVFGGYPCIIKTGDFIENSRAVYISVDMLVPVKDSRFSFLSDNVNKEYYRIKARKIRGIFSMGLLIPAEEGWEVGQNVQEQLGVKKWEPDAHFVLQGENEVDKHYMPVYTDIEGYRKYRDVFEDGELVVVSEKLHGANHRVVYKDEQLWVGSHKCIKKFREDNLFWQMAIKYKLEEKLKDFPDMVFFGEIYGQVQKGFDYGVPKGTSEFRVFDIFDNKQGKYLDWEQVEDFCKKAGLLTVPVLYKGPFNQELFELRNGQSTLGNHTREGCVIKPLKETWHPKLGRKIIKVVGENYLLTKHKE